jgi:hypothetical protein
MTRSRNDRPATHKRKSPSDRARPDAIAARLRTDRALELCIDGHNFRQIGELPETLPPAAYRPYAEQKTENI